MVTLQQAGEDISDEEAVQSIHPSAPPGYEIVAELGRGGMGVVYLARQTQLGRDVALKMILRGGYASADDRARFLAEAETIAALNHPGIVQLYDFGHHAGLPYFAVEYCPGGSLAKRLKGVPLPPTDAAKLVSRLAETMHAAHTHGVIHRDLNPSNVLLQRATENGTANQSNRPSEEKTDPDLAAPAWADTGLRSVRSVHPKITDFGLAKRVERSSGVTQSGAVLGTPSYMPPEQASGGGKQVGAAADIYALGAILYETLTGRPPFRAASPMDTLFQVINDEPVPPRRLNPQVPTDLETVCLKCLSKDPARRYATAADLAKDLRRFLVGAPVHARAVSQAERILRWCRRNPALAAMSAVAAGLVLALAVGSVVAASVFRYQRDEAISAREVARQRLRDSHLSEARALRSSGRPGRRFNVLDTLRQAAEIRPGDDLRTEAIAALSLCDIRYQTVADGLQPNTNVFNADSTMYAGWEDDGTITVVGTDDNQTVARLAGPGVRPYIIEFSPDGLRLAAKYHRANRDAENVCIVWDIAGGKEVVRTPGPVRKLAFSADSQFFAASYPGDSIGLFSARTGQPVRQLTAKNSNRICFSPDGQQLAWAPDGKGPVEIMSVEDGQAIQKLNGPTFVFGLAYSPDGTMMAAADQEGVLIWDLPSGGLRRHLRHHTHVVSQVALSASGDLLATTSWDGRLVLCRPQSGERLLEDVGFSGLLAFGGGDRFLGARWLAKRLDRIDVACGREFRRFPPVGAVSNRRWDVDLAPDGRLAALASTTGVELFDRWSGHVLATIPLDVARTAAFLPDGSAFIVWGREGLNRWPVEWSADKSLATIGPPRALGVTASRFPEWGALSRDGRVFAAGDRTRDCVTLVDLVNEKVIREVKTKNPSRIALDPTGRRLALGSWSDAVGYVRCWDVATGEIIFDEPCGNGSAMAFSPDGQRLLINQPDQWRVIDLESRKTVWTTPSQELVHRGATWSADGQWIAVSSEVNLFQIARADSGEVVATIPGDAPLAFNTDGNLLITINEVIDLGQVRAQLGEIGLDWLPHGKPAAPPPPFNPMRVVIR